MFEVGKLTDESLDSFLGELEKVSPKNLDYRDNLPTFYWYR